MQMLPRPRYDTGQRTGNEFPCIAMQKLILVVAIRQRYAWPVRPGVYSRISGSHRQQLKENSDIYKVFH